MNIWWFPALFYLTAPEDIYGQNIHVTPTCCLYISVWR